jgi:RimJ/RimL family protein N-acetyltransferase
VTLTLRPATADDARLLWEWRNDPSVRAVSFQQEPIPWTNHQEWLGKKLQLDSCRIWILECDSQSAGQVRYEREGAAAEVSFSIASEFRGRSLAARMLKMSAPLACRELGVDLLTGLVKSGNTASRMTFERAGYALAQTGKEDVLTYECACTQPAL